MNTYQDQTITPEDLSSNESLSDFTTCAFDGAFERINFSYAKFTGCDFSDATFEQCNFLSIDGNGPANGGIEFASAPAADTRVMYDDVIIGIGDGIETVYAVSLLNIDDSKVVVLDLVEIISDGQPDMVWVPIDAPFASINSQYELCNMTVGPKDRTQALADRAAIRVLSVDSDAVDDTSPIDGIKDIAADGVSTCKILIDKQDLDGASKTGTETVILDTTRGKLASLEVDLVAGKAEVVLTSIAETTVATITVRDKAGVLIAGETQVQFAP